MARDAPVEFERDEGRCDGLRRAGEVADELVLGERRGAEAAEDLLMQQAVSRSERRAAPARGWRPAAGQRHLRLGRIASAAGGSAGRASITSSALRTSVAPSRMSMLQPEARASIG